MDSNDLYQSLNEIDDEILQRSENVSSKIGSKKSFLRKRFAAIAACVAIIVGVTLTSEAANGSVSNFFAPLFGFAQADIVDSIGRPIGVSVSADGYTLTAEAVIGDRYNVAVIYTLRREDGQPIPDDLYFADWESNIPSMTSSGGGLLSTIADAEHPNQITLIETWSGSRPLFGRYITVSFSNLSIRGEEGNDRVVADGPWELHYTLRYQDSTQSVPVDHLKVTAEDGRKYQVDKILLSPVGLHIQGLYFDPVWGEQNTLRDFDVSIQKENGDIISLVDTTGGCSFAQNDTSADIRFEAMFQQPIPLDEIKSLVICNEEVPVQ